MILIWSAALLWKEGRWMLFHVAMSSTRKRRRWPANFLSTHSSRENSLNLHQTQRVTRITPQPLPHPSIPYQPHWYHIGVKAFSGINMTDISSEMRRVSVKITVFVHLFTTCGMFFRYSMYYFSIYILYINQRYAIDDANGNYNYNYNVERTQPPNNTCKSLRN